MSSVFRFFEADEEMEIDVLLEGDEKFDKGGDTFDRFDADMFDCEAVQRSVERIGKVAHPSSRSLAFSELDDTQLHSSGCTQNYSTPHTTKTTTHHVYCNKRKMTQPTATVGTKLTACQKVPPT